MKSYLITVIKLITKGFANFPGNINIFYTNINYLFSLSSSFFLPLFSAKWINHKNRSLRALFHILHFHLQFLSFFYHLQQLKHRNQLRHCWNSIFWIWKIFISRTFPVFDNLNKTLHSFDVPFLRFMQSTFSEVEFHPKNTVRQK